MPIKTLLARLGLIRSDHGAKGPRSPARRPPAFPLSDKQIVQARLQASGLNDATDAEIDFVISHNRTIARSVWKDPAFVEMCERRGLGKPKDAWFSFVNPCNHALSSAADLRRSGDAGIAEVKFRFGGMLAGRCSYSERIDGKVVSIDKAPALPPTECEHPDQCGCRWQAWIPLIDEIE